MPARIPEEQPVPKQRPDQLLGVRKIAVNERERTIAVEYDATRMDQNGVANLLRRLGMPLAQEVGPVTGWPARPLS